MSSKANPAQGAVIIDSVVISNSRIRVNESLIAIPFQSLQTNERSVLEISRKDGHVRVVRGPFIGKMSHESLLEDIEIDDHRTQKNNSLNRSSFQI